VLADQRGRPATSRCQRPIEIGETGYIPGGLGVAEQKKTHGVA